MTIGAAWLWALAASLTFWFVVALGIKTLVGLI
jgi:hypothetical protein